MQGRPPTPESQASLFRSPSPSLSQLRQPLSLFRLTGGGSFASLHFSLVRFHCLDPTFDPRISSTDPSSARSPDYTRLCNIHPTILYSLYRKLSSHLTRAWLPTRASCIPIYSGAWIEEGDCVRKPRRIDLVRLTMIR